MMENNFDKLKAGLTKTRKGFLSKIIGVLGKKGKISEEILENLEQILIEGDVGVSTSTDIIKNIKERCKSNKDCDLDKVLLFLKEEIQKIFENNDTYQEEKFEQKPWIILVAGVNGTGKTTTIGKLAYYYKNSEKDVLVVAADTYRAAAIEQLDIWRKRAKVDMVRSQHGAEPASVVYDSIKAAISRNIDVLIIDTAGRIHTKQNLMEELKKINKVVNKLIPDAPHEVLLVLDANMGQNAISQANEFLKSIKVNGIILTKLDGTAKGGVIIPIKRELGIPVKYVGIGEEITDLEIFNPKRFVDALFSF